MLYSNTWHHLTLLTCPKSNCLEIELFDHSIESKQMTNVELKCALYTDILKTILYLNYAKLN